MSITGVNLGDLDIPASTAVDFELALNDVLGPLIEALSEPVENSHVEAVRYGIAIDPAGKEPHPNHHLPTIRATCPDLGFIQDSVFSLCYGWSTYGYVCDVRGCVCVCAHVNLMDAIIGRF